MKKTNIFILILCFAITFGGCANNQKKLYLSDAESLIETIEITHPVFSLDEISDRYINAKSYFLSEAENEMTYDEFTWCVQRYLASLNDGHTIIQNQTRSKFIDVKWQAVGEKLFLLDSDGIISDNEVISIGGVPVSDIFNIIDDYYDTENETAGERNHTLWSRSKDLLLLCNSNISGDKISVLISNGSGASEDEYKIKNMDIYDFYIYYPEVTSKIIDNVFYIDYNTCKLGNQLSKVTSELEKAISDGITSVIIDARDNSGGNSEANKAILEAMGMAEPQYGIYLRYSPLLSKQWGREENSGSIEYPRDIMTAQTNPDINLVVLVNANTYSAATMLGVNVQDGSLGTIIGQPSSNAPNCYGDVLNYSLPDSKIKVTISCKKFLRPDENADPNSLIPDIITEYNEDALDIALKFLKEK